MARSRSPHSHIRSARLRLRLAWLARLAPFSYPLGSPCGCASPGSLGSPILISARLACGCASPGSLGSPILISARLACGCASLFNILSLLAELLERGLRRDHGLRDLEVVR